MVDRNNIAVERPTADVADELRKIIGVTGTVLDAMGGYRIHIHHSSAFPWDKVMKALVYRRFKVYVRSHKADLQIEAEP